MVTLYPDPLPTWVRENHRRRAECRVYDALRAQLAGEWQVFYSRPWLGLDRNGLEKEGEADFVLAHPELGLLVLEVKGGGIERDALADQWWSTDGDGLRHRIRDPLAQANRNKHALLEILRRDPGWGTRFIRACHGVIFPDCIVPEEDLGADMPRWLFAGIDQMRHIASWIQIRMRAGSDPTSVAPLGVDGIEILRSHFARSFTLQRPAAASLQSDDEEIRFLTDEQVRILDIFDDGTRVAIAGPAGTGKTALAQEQSRRIARSGSRVLLLCFNRPLARQLEREIGRDPLIVVSSFHALCAELSARAGQRIRPRPGYDTRTLYDHEYPRALQSALDRLPDERFDAVVIDEGQDFSADWLPAIERLLRDPERGRLLVFHDDNQKVHSAAGTLPGRLPRGGVRLKRILRNGRRIVSDIDPLLPRPYTASGPEGSPIIWRETRTPLSAADVTVALAELCSTERVRPDQIAVLVRDETARSSLVVNGAIGDFRVSDAESPPTNRVVCDTVRRFKGLERPVVILIEPEDYIGEPELLYVAMTRARLRLMLLGSRGRLAQLATLLDRNPRPGAVPV